VPGIALHVAAKPTRAELKALAVDSLGDLLECTETWRLNVCD
jgi:hypothetical protein